ncbi:MAG: prepilin-type N-terminal cleavage/methylation domain-containing protein [Lachnospiraceae bacterium]|nr:prepilin-type N-terminal cleavage/methylation domain-containing protein [Lachnospiraceae bacterium]
MKKMEKKQKIFHFHNRIHKRQRTTCPVFRSNNQGMTMVEVLMGFVILALLLGMFSGIIVTASNMYYNSVDLKRAHESLQGAVYSESITGSLSPEGVTLKLVPAEGMPEESTPIAFSKTKMYKISSATVLSAEEAESLDVDIYFLKTDPPSEKESSE